MEARSWELPTSSHAFRAPTSGHTGSPCSSWGGSTSGYYFLLLKVTQPGAAIVLHEIEGSRHVTVTVVAAKIVHSLSWIFLWCCNPWYFTVLWCFNPWYFLLFSIFSSHHRFRWLHWQHCPIRKYHPRPWRKTFLKAGIHQGDNLDRFYAFKWCLLSPCRVKSPVFCGFSKSHVVLRHKVGTRKVSDHTCKSEMRTNPKMN